MIDIRDQDKILKKSCEKLNFFSTKKLNDISDIIIGNLLDTNKYHAGKKNFICFVDYSNHSNDNTKI